MARARTNKLYRTFVKGLITEASPLTYPEDASIDELNTVLSRKGNRTRRRGIRYEENHQVVPMGESPYDAVNEFVWHSVAKQPGKQVMVVQFGGGVHFWDMQELPLSDKKISFKIDLTQKKIASATTLDVRTNLAQFSAGSGYLFIAHPYCEPLVVEFDPVKKDYAVFNVIVQVRDLEGINDGLANDQEPPTLSKEHHYNLLNQGWLAPGTIPAPALGLGESPPTVTTPGVTPPTPPPGTGGGFTDPYTGNTYPYTRTGGGMYREGLNFVDRQ